MKKCKNCGIEINERLTYCSLSCRNIFVNKNLRDYSKLIKKYEEEYSENPKLCLNCNNIIPYQKRENKFCNHSCSTTYTNKDRVGIKHNLSIDGYESIIKSNLSRYVDNKIEYEKCLHHCINCDNELTYTKRKNKFCDKKCQIEYHKKNKTEIQNYLKECEFKFNLNDFPNEFDFELIKNYGWYKAKNHGNNLNGISRDHMYSRMEGFRQQINPKIISHPANCKLVRHNENVSKLDKCSISFDNLIIKINEWNEKYLPR